MYLQIILILLVHPTILWEQGDVFSCSSTQHVAPREQTLTQQMIGCQQFYGSTWCDECTSWLLTILNSMTQNPPPIPPHYCRIMWCSTCFCSSGWLSFPDQCKCEAQITCFWDGRWHFHQISHALSVYPWWQRQVKYVQEENCCVPCEPNRYSTSAISDQLYNHKEMNTINYTLRGNAFKWDMNAQWWKLPQNYHAFFTNYNDKCQSKYRHDFYSTLWQCCHCSGYGEHKAISMVMLVYNAGQSRI
jgi:hypothetical protein